MRMKGSKRAKDLQRFAMTERPVDRGKYRVPPAILGGTHPSSRAMNRRSDFADEMKKL
jgi:hypothetical protein